MGAVVRLRASAAVSAASTGVYSSAWERTQNQPDGNKQRDASAISRRISLFRSAGGTGPLVLGRDILVGLNMHPVALVPPVENGAGDEER